MSEDHKWCGHHLNLVITPRGKLERKYNFGHLLFRKGQIHMYDGSDWYPFISDPFTVTYKLK